MPKPNLRFIDELAQGEQKFKEKLIGIIKEELPIEVAVYKEKYLENCELAAQCVHKLKHKISILGMSDSYEKAAYHEAKLRNGSRAGHDEFVEILDRMMNFIEQL